MKSGQIKFLNSVTRDEVGSKDKDNPNVLKL